MPSNSRAQHEHIAKKQGPVGPFHLQHADSKNLLLSPAEVRLYTLDLQIYYVDGTNLDWGQRLVVSLDYFDQIYEVEFSGS